MRFLFVYETAAGKARDLLAELLVTDVHLIVARRGEMEPGESDMALILAHQGSEAAACELNRKYRKVVAAHVQFTVEPKKFRVEDVQLRAWLNGTSEEAATIAAPTDSFSEAVRGSPALVIFPHALDQADRLDPSRWLFAARSADLLARLATRPATVGPLRQWEAAHGIAFAANGRVSYDYAIQIGGDRWKGSSEWHLKAGDRTTPERAARIYFTTARVGLISLVLVAYVGPHPADGGYAADFGDLDESAFAVEGDNDR